MKMAADLSCAGPEDVACDVCSGRKRQAHISCLMCLVSYCEQHLQPHLDAPALMEHNLVPSSSELQEIIRSQRDEKKKMSSRTDQQVVGAAAREKEMDQSYGKIPQQIHEREKEVKRLQEEEKNITAAADKAVQVCKESLKQLNRELERRMAAEEHKLRSLQQSEVTRVRGRREQLQKEIAELRKKEAELQQLPLTDSHMVLLQNFPFLSEVSRGVFSGIPVLPQVQRGQLYDLPEEGLIPGPRTRPDFLEYSQNISMDPNTAHSWLMLSKGHMTVTATKQDQSPPPHPGRFTFYPQVLSTEPLAGRCYWEVEKTGVVEIAVSDKNISRSGEGSLLGNYPGSLSLCCRNSGYSFRRYGLVTQLPAAPSSRVGVYLDISSGLLSFYSVSETMTLIHRVQTSFTQPLHAGLCVWASSTCEFVKLK